MFLQDLVETRQLKIIGGQIMPMKTEKKEAIQIELLQEEIEEAIEDEVIEEILVVVEEVSNHMGMIELIISKREVDLIKREVHGEEEEVIAEDVFGMSELMKFKFN
jgi:preprotein translocase subunit SecD